MHFNSDINRPPYEASDAFLQVTKGCSHGSKGGCDFCTFYKNCAFAPSPMDEIEADVRELQHMGRRFPFRRIFLQGANSLVLPYRRLVEVAGLIHRALPQVESIGGYARVDDLTNKNVDQLRHLAELGYSNFYFGNESGDDHLLSRMHKGYEAEHVTLPESIRGILPQDKEVMLAQLSRLMGDARAGKLDHFRETVMSL